MDFEEEEEGELPPFDGELVMKYSMMENKRERLGLEKRTVVLVWFVWNLDRAVVVVVVSKGMIVGCCMLGGLNKEIYRLINYV